MLLLNVFTPPTALPIITVTCLTAVPCSAWYPSACAADARAVPAVALLSAVQNLPAAFAAAVSSHALLLPLGVVTGKKFNECPDHLMELSMRVNAEAHFWTTQAVLPKMIEKNEGHIVSIASSAGICGVPGLADYCASKHAAVGFDESIRLELRSQGKTGVKTTCVQPFFIKTGMFEGAQSRWPRVLPLLDPDYAAGKIVRAIQCDQPVLMMPMILHLMPTLRALLPVQVFDQMADWMGVLDAMHDFKGGMTGTRAHTAVKN